MHCLQRKGSVSLIRKCNPFRVVSRAASTSTISNYKVDYSEILKKHTELGKKEWTHEEIIKTTKANTLFSWGATEAYANAALVISRGEGSYFYDVEGRKYLDFNSQAMCSNLGHTVPQPVIDEVNAQMKSIAYSYPCASVTPIKAKLSALLADMLPGDLNHFFYTTGGAESNETAMRIARLKTGRYKILARYRSYHGGTLATMGLTGDPRRWYAEPTTPGVVHFLDPQPYSMTWGASEEEISHRSLEQLREVLMYEGPKNVAAIFLESVTGTNGILVPPKGYLEGVRAICDEHGILMVCDEVMNGFGRTGTLFGFMNSTPMVIPDVVTMAKGINGAFIPLGAVAVRDHVADHFMKNPIGIGSTYNSHPIGLASAYAALKYFLEKKVLDNVQTLAPVLKEQLEKLKQRHPTVKGYRSIGLFGIVELQKNAAGEPYIPYNGPAHPALTQFRGDLLAGGLFTLMRWSSFFTNPPLTISKEELLQGFEIIDQALTTLDRTFQK